jgi:hypothetical protein
VVKTLSSKLVFSVVLSLALVSACYADAEFELVSRNDPLYNEALSAAVKWKDALLKKDFDELASFALPESKEHVESALTDKRSDLYRLFYDTQWMRKQGARSFYDILKSAKEPRIILQKDKDIEDLGIGIDVFYYDESKVKLKFPLDIKDIKDKRLQKMLDQGKLIYIVLFKEDGRWRVNYDLFDEGDESEEPGEE